LERLVGARYKVTCQIIKTGFSDMQRQTGIEKTRGKRSLVAYSYVKERCVCVWGGGDNYVNLGVGRRR
jgi:hypothetical protein